jgi:hypothetical protein
MKAEISAVKAGRKQSARMGKVTRQRTRTGRFLQMDVSWSVASHFASMVRQREQFAPASLKRRSRTIQYGTKLSHQFASESIKTIECADLKIAIRLESKSDAINALQQ